MSKVEMDYENPSARDWGREHHQFLKEAAPGVLRSLSASGSLEQYLKELGNQASERESHMMAAHHASPEVQNLPHLQRVKELQNRHAEIQELIRHDLIRQPAPD